MLRDQIFAFGCNEFRAVYGKERLALTDGLVCCIRENLLYVPRETRLNLGKPSLIDRHRSGNANFVLNRFPLDFTELHSNRLKALDR